MLVCCWRGCWKPCFLGSHSIFANIQARESVANQLRRCKSHQMRRLMKPETRTLTRVISQLKRPQLDETWACYGSEAAFERQHGAEQKPATPLIIHNAVL